jgi:hypothetical protein
MPPKATLDVMLRAVARLTVTLQSGIRRDTIDMVPIALGEHKFVVPACVIKVTLALVKKYNFCERETWDKLVCYLRSLCLWPPLDLYQFRLTIKRNWPEILDDSDLDDRLERSMAQLRFMCPDLIATSTHGVTVAQNMFGFNMDRNPSMELAQTYLGDNLTYPEYTLLHFAMLGAFIMDAAPMFHQGTRVDVLKGTFLVNLRPGDRLSTFVY